MTDDFLTDQQQADRIKDWFRENGLSLVGGVVLGLAGLFGWQQWQGSQRGQAEQASVTYEALLAAVRAQNLEDTEALLKELDDRFGKSPYTDQAHLAMARLQLERNRPEEAAAQLQRVVARGNTEVIRHIARLRLARVLIFQEKYDEALATLQKPGDSAFTAAYHDVRGDAYVGLNRYDEARREYEQALSDDDAQGMFDRGFVQAKLDELAPAGAAGAEPAADAPPAG